MYKTTFSDVGNQKSNFEITTESEPTTAELLECVIKNTGKNDVRLSRGGVMFCNGNPGCYVRYGSYATTQV